MNNSPVLIFLFVISFTLQLFGDNPVDVYLADLEKVKAKYRVNQSAVLKKADRVVLYIVSFDKLNDGDLDADDVGIQVSPYDLFAPILKEKDLDKKEREKVLKALTNEIVKPVHSGGAFCHFPIHGIRIFRGEEILHEGTFCWVCKNFGFNYPGGAEWLDTSVELKELFLKLLPIPKEELQRFHKKHPKVKPKK